MTIEEFWQQDPPYFFRRVVERWAQVEREAEEKEAAKAVKKAAKKAEREGVAISPAVAAYFTDDPAVTKPLGYVWVCQMCKAAPRKHPDFPNSYKWKTEKGFLAHVSSDRCFGVKPWA